VKLRGRICETGRFKADSGVMDEQSGKSKEKDVMDEWRNWYQKEVDEEIKGVGSRDKVKHNKRSDQLFFREDDFDGRARVTTKKLKTKPSSSEETAGAIVRGGVRGGRSETTVKLRGGEDL